MTDDIFDPSTEEENAHLQQLFEECKEIITNKVGIEMVNCEIDFTICNYCAVYCIDTQYILVDYNYYKHCIKYNNYNSLYSIIIHEILHAIAEQKQPKTKHGGLWKELAQMVNEATEYDIKRVGGLPHIEGKEYKYIIECESCGEKFGYKKMCKIIKKIREKQPFIYCPYCGSGKFEVIKN